ncbi:MAG: hypothetical protein WA973_09150 [Mesorhizobium sp.]
MAAIAPPAQNPRPHPREAPGGFRPAKNYFMSDIEDASLKKRHR